MSYAIIETGGKQVRVEPGRFYDIELLPVEAEETITMENVLLVQHNGEVTIGQPFVAGATVEGTVMRHFRGRKIIVYKMKPKKKTRKKRGHRQEITRLMINSISLNGSVIASASERNEETPVPVATGAEEPAPEATPTAEATTGEASAPEETTETASE
jgi:large subunit ribosomal protein L21